LVDDLYINTVRIRPDATYFNLRTPENNPGWRTRWFYAKDQPAASRTIRLKEFHTTSDLRPKQSWENALTEEEMAITEPLVQKITQLRSTLVKEVTGLQLIRMFIER
jgi:hypothetical protein